MFTSLITHLCTIRDTCRHWQKLSEDLGMQVLPKPTLTFSKCLEMGLQHHTEAIAKVAEVAGKEFSIEQALDKMESEWEPVLLDIVAYKETGTFIMKCAEETAQMLDDHIVMTQAMSFSPYKKPFEGRITTWENKLRTTQVCAFIPHVYFCMYVHVCIIMCIKCDLFREISHLQECPYIQHTWNT